MSLAKEILTGLTIMHEDAMMGSDGPVDAKGNTLKEGDRVQGAGPDGPMITKYNWNGYVSRDDKGTVTAVGKDDQGNPDPETPRITVKWDAGTDGDHNALEVEKI